jgi:cytochrome c biogenesis protein CcmG/thiol:disulfide interchange protein DsbE
VHWQRYLTIAIVALAIGFSAYLVAPVVAPGVQATPKAVTAKVGLAPGDIPPNFTLPTANGGTVTLSRLRGHAVWINFWATWCPWCQREMGNMERLHEHYGSSLVILGIAVQQSASQVKPFLDARHITYPVLLDQTGAVATSYDVNALPVSVFVAPDGRITAYYPGSLLNTASMKHLIAAALHAP